MNFKVLLKQSFKDFQSKAIVYMTFTIFLTLALSLVIGLFSFTLTMTRTTNNIIGVNNWNGYMRNVSYRLDDEKTDSSNYAFRVKNDGTLLDFARKIISNSNFSPSHPDILSNDIARTLIAITGISSGRMTELSDSSVLDVNKYLTDNSNEGDDSFKPVISREEYNELINEILSSKLNDTLKLSSGKDFDDGWKTTSFTETNIPPTVRNFSTNLIYLNMIWKLKDSQNSNFTYTPIPSFSDLDKEKYMWISPSKKQSDEDLVWDSTPSAIKEGDALRVTYYDTISRSDLSSDDQTKYFDKGKYLYATPKTAKQKGWKLGDKVIININTDQFIYMGTANSDSLILLGPEQSGYILPYAQLGYDTLISWGILFNFEDAKNLNQGQNLINKNLEKMFYPKKQGEQIVSSENLKYAISTMMVQRSVGMYRTLVTIIAALVLTLLFIVFYFITHQIILLQRKTLFFLKAMGESNAKITLLTTLAMLVPVFIATSLSIIGATFIQSMMFNAVTSAFSFIIPYWTFGWYFWVSLGGIAAIMLISFFAINYIIINGKTLTIGGINAVKSPSKSMIKFKEFALKKTTSKFNIGASFVLKNVYKNIVTLVVLLSCFTIFMFAMQMASSIKYTAGAYERWNQPYKSAMVNGHLDSFSFNDNHKPNVDNFKTIRSEEEIGESIDIGDDFDFGYDAQKFVNFVKKINGQIKQGNYFSKETVQKILNKNTFNEIKRQLNNPIVIFLLAYTYNQESPTNIVTYAEVKNEAQSFLNAYQLILDSYMQLNATLELSEENQISLLFGEAIIPNDTRQYLAMSGTSNNWSIEANSTTIAVSQKDTETMRHFQLYNQRIVDSKDKTKKVLEVNVSADLASRLSLKTKTEFSTNIFNVINSDNSVINLTFKVNKIIKDSPIEDEIYTSKEMFFNYIQEISNDSTDAMYEPLLKNSEKYQNYLNNSSYSTDFLPMGLKYLTLPIYNHDADTEGSKGLGFDSYYSSNKSDKIKTYYQNIPNSVLPFSYITAIALRLGEPIINIMNHFLVIVVLIALAVSLILIALILLENKDVILLMKSIGYRTSQINLQLVMGYLIAAMLSSIGSAGATYWLISFVSPIFRANLGMSIMFSSNALFYIVAIILGISFSIMISASIGLYTRLQKPKDAFSTL